MIKSRKRSSLLLTLALIPAVLAVLIVTAAAADISTWSELYAAMQNGGEIRLTTAVTRGAGDGAFANEALEVPLGTNVTLDLNGFAVNAASGGCVVTVAQGGSLTVRDDSAGQTGSLTGGSDSFGGGVYLSDGGSFTLAGGSISGNASGGEGGGVYVDGGSFTMTGGSIAGNTAAHHGGGVYLSGSGSFTMTGGSITGNACGSGEGGGVYIAGGDFRLSGAPGISGNRKGSADNNVYLASGKKITLTGALTNSAPIGVNMESPAVTPDPGAFTVGWSSFMNANDPGSRFTSENSGCGIGLSAGGEARLAPYHAIVLQSSGSGTVNAPEKAAEGTVVTLTVTPDSGYAADTLTVTYTDINDQQLTAALTQGAGNTYTFVMPGYPSFEADRSVTVNAAFLASEPAFRGHALVLSGEIGIRFSMDLAALTQAEKSGSYMVFTVNGQATQVNTADAELLSDGRYQYTCFVNTLQMAEKVTAVFHYGSGGAQTVENQFSVEDYVKYIAAHPGDYSETARNLAGAIADYGHYAQIFLTEVNGIPGGKYAAMNTCYTASYDTQAVKAAVDGYRLTVNKGSSKLSDDTMMRLTFDSETALSVRLTVTDDTPLTASAQWNGNTVYAEKQSDGSYILRINGIKASQLADVITISGDAGGAFSAEVSALAYARSILNSDTMNANAKNAVSALYQYCRAADAYRANPGSN